MKKFFSKDYILKLVSFIIAIIIWCYIIIVLDPPVDVVVKDIPIRYVQQNALMDQGLSIVSESKSTLELKIRGSRKKLANVNSKNILATVDLSSVTKSGMQVLPIDLSIPYEYSEIVTKKPYNVELNIDKIVEEKRNIQVKTVGNPEPGYIAGTVIANPQTVLLKGAASVISRISSVRVSVDVNKANKDITEVEKIEFVDSSGNVITGDDEMDLVSSDVLKVEIFCPIMKLKTVPIKADLSSHLPAGKTISIQPNAVTVYGYEEELSGIEEIKTTRVSVNTLINAGSVSVDIRLPENLKLRDDVSSVTIKLNKAE